MTYNEVSSLIIKSKGEKNMESKLRIIIPIIVIAMVPVAHQPTMVGTQHTIL